MRRKYFVFLSLVLLVSLVSFSSATIELGNQSHFIQQNYKEGQNITGWLNISFNSEPLDSILSDSLGNEISLIELFNSSLNSNYSYFCNTYNCSNDYSEKSSAISKTFTLASGEEKIIGFKFKGDLKNINNIEFKVKSNSSESCVGQLEIDLANDGTIDFGNNKISSNLCSEEETKSCYDESMGPVESELTFAHQCQEFNLSAAPGFKAGLWAKRVRSGTQKINMELYKPGSTTPISSCSFSSSNSAGGYSYCDMNYFIPEEGIYYLCAYADNTGKPNEYRIKGYESSNDSKTCGLSLGSSGFREISGAYAFSMIPKKFNTFGTITINNSVSGGFSSLVEKYLYEKYGTFDCLDDKCYFPILLKSNTPQNIEIFDLKVNYDTQANYGITNSYILELEEKASSVDSDFQKLHLTGFNIPNNLNEEDYSIYLNGEKLLEELIFIGDFLINLKYDYAIEKIETLFNVEAILDDEILSYKLTIEGENIESNYSSLKYTFNETGNYSIIVEVKTRGGEVYSEQKIIEVSPLKESLGTIIANRKLKINSLEQEINLLGSGIREEIREYVNIESQRSNLTFIENEYKAAKNDEDYLKIVPKIESILYLPSKISVNAGPKSFFIIDDYHVNAEYIEDKPYGSSDADVKNYILYWTSQKISLDYSYKDISILDDGEYELNSFRTISLEINPKTTINEDYFLYLRKKTGTEILDNSKEDREVYEKLKLNGKRFVEIKVEEGFTLEELPFFIAPKISENLIDSEVIPEYQKSNRWLIFVLLFLLLITGGLIAYYFLGKWYDEKYEKKLFPNKNDIFNLINYIARSKKNGVPESKIKKNLMNSQWSSEQVRFILRKYLGKNTGMYAFFKRKAKIENRAQMMEERRLNMRENLVEQNNNKIKNLKERNIALIVILSIFTLGLYYFIWLLISSLELRKVSKKAPSSNLIKSLITLCVVMVLVLLIPILLLETVGSTWGTISIIIFIVSNLTAFIIFIVILFKYSNAHAEITGSNSTTNLLLLFFLSFIGAAILQDKLNKVAK